MRGHINFNQVDLLSIPYTVAAFQLRLIDTSIIFREPIINHKRIANNKQVQLLARKRLAFIFQKSYVFSYVTTVFDVYGNLICSIRLIDIYQLLTWINRFRKYADRSSFNFEKEPPVDYTVLGL